MSPSQRPAVNFASIRSILFVPGDSPRKLARAAGLRADAFILDWEDAVPESNKEVARRTTGDAMAALATTGATILIRINSYRPDLLGRDCDAVRDCRPHGVVLAKCESAEGVEAVLNRLPDRTAVVPLLESPMGVLQAPRIAACSPRVPALLFGAEDYSVDARIMRTADEPELLFARGSVVNAARAMSKEVFDSPLMHYGDLTVVRDAAWRSRRLGFTGRAAIHPRQVPVINEVFSPSQAEIDAAKAAKAV